MLLEIKAVLSPETCATLRDRLGAAQFAESTPLANRPERLVKRNAEALEGPVTSACRDTVLSALAASAAFQRAALPKRILGPTFSRYWPGDSFAIHVDEAMQDGSRTDLAFTLCLADPAAYDGGELVIKHAGGEETVKAEAGSLVLYEPGSLHEVRPVTRGERLAAVGWVRSLVRDPAQRELLADLDAVRRTLFEFHGKTVEFDLLSRCQANLLRMWAED